MKLLKKKKKMELVNQKSNQKERSNKEMKKSRIYM